MFIIYNFQAYLFREKRLELLTNWRRKGGVLLIGYTAFRNLSLGKYVKDLDLAKDISHVLQVIHHLLGLAE